MSSGPPAAHSSRLPGNQPSRRAACQPQAAAAEEDDDQSEYSEMLTSKLRSQESFEVFIARAVTDLIDRDSLSQVADQPVARRLPDLRGTARHQSRHQRRRTPRQRQSAPQHAPLRLPPLRHHTPRRAGRDEPAHRFLRRRVPRQARPEPGARDFPVMVVNPSCEQLLLERDGTGGWRNATLDEFAALGLRPATGDFPPRTRRSTRTCARTA